MAFPIHAGLQADYNATAPYFTTIQRHSFSTIDGAEGIVGTYYTSKDWSGTPVLVRNDFMLSFHFLNYGPDPLLLPASTFSARWEGFVTPDTTVHAAIFSLTERGGALDASLWIDGNKIITPNQTQSTPVSLTKGQKVKVTFECKHGKLVPISACWSPPLAARQPRK